jgi:hypothetical protein
MQRHVGFAFTAPALLNLFKIGSRADGIGETEDKGRDRKRRTSRRKNGISIDSRVSFAKAHD